MESLHSVPNPSLQPIPSTLPATRKEPAKTDTQAQPEERFISSDMAQMLDDIQRVDPAYIRKSTPAPEEKITAPQPERFMSPDMAQMVEDIQRAEETLTRDSLGTKLITPSMNGGSSNNPVVLAADMGDVYQVQGLQLDGHKKHLVSQGLTGAHLGLEAAEAGGLLLQGAAQHVGETAATVGHGVEAASHTAEAAGATAHGAAEGAAHVGGTVSGLLIGGAVGAGVIAGGMAALGVHSIAQGIKEKDGEKILEGSGETILGAKSAASAITMAGHGATEGILGTLAHGAHTVLTPLGLIHGAIDVTLGAKKVYDGKKHGKTGEVVEGFLEAGQGVAIGAAALGGGVPAILVAVALLGTKLYVHHRNQKEAHARGPGPEAHKAA